MIDQFQLQKLIDLPIESVASRLGLEVNRHKALCPFHQDSHPSLTFNVSKNRYRCYVCGAYGRTIDLAMHILGKSFLESCQWLADEGNIIIEQWKPVEKPQQKVAFDSSRYERYFEHPYLNEKACDFLFNKRHLDPRVIRFCRLNSYRDKNGINWLQIPYYDTAGKLVGVQSRNLDYKKDSPCPRFRFPESSSCHLYNQQIIPMLKDGEPLYISEGCSDCWSLLSSGHKCVAIPSATLLKPEDLNPLKGRVCHIYPDQDNAGNLLYEHLLSASVQIGFCLIRHQLPQGCKDFSDYYMINVKR